MIDTPETQKMCRIDDPVTKIGYKIIYRASKDRYEIWTQYKDNKGKTRRNRVKYAEAIRREHDLKSLTDYVREYLVGQHIRFYDDAGIKGINNNKKSIVRVPASNTSVQQSKKKKAWFKNQAFVISAGVLRKESVRRFAPRQT